MGGGCVTICILPLFTRAATRRLLMFQRLVGSVVTAVGILLAFIIGFWALLLLGLAAIVAVCVYAVRTRHWRRGGNHRADVIEGEFEIVENDKTVRQPGHDELPPVHDDDHDHV